MSRKTFLHITEPCHENWDNMTALQQGRFCESCAKAVTDFSGMSDEQILRVLSKAPGKVCGRFYNDQLARPLHESASATKRPFKIFIAALIPAFLSSAIANAQQHVKSKRSQPIAYSRHAMGFVLPKETLTSEGQKTIKGVVLNEEQQPVPFATVSVDDKGVVAADSAGRFTVTIPAGGKAQLSISAVGYKTQTIAGVDAADTVRVQMTKNVVLPEVVVTASNDWGSMRMGGIRHFRRVTHSDVLKSSLWSRVNQEVFRAYPNPVDKGGEINMVFRKAGSYTIQLMDNNGRLYLHKELDVTSDKQQVSLTIPTEMAAGNYFLRAAYGSKQQFVVKLIVK